MGRLSTGGFRMTTLSAKARVELVHQIRRLVFSNRTFASIVVALALAMKLIVPAGFMPTISGGHFVISICSGTGPMTMAMAMPGMDHDKTDKNGQHSKADMPCPFTGLASPSLAAADVLLLAAAILFAMALGIRAVVALRTTPSPYLRPPLRGPPVKV